MTFAAFCARCKKKVKKAERIIRYFDMFAGVGGFRAGLDLAGGFQCIGHCEIDKYADASYRAIHAPGKEEVYYPDARTIAVSYTHLDVYKRQRAAAPAPAAAPEREKRHAEERTLFPAGCSGSG